MVIPVKGNVYSEREVYAFGLSFYKELNEFILFTKDRMKFWFLQKAGKLKLLTYY